MTFDSKDEEYFSWWCQELKDAGIIHDYGRCTPYVLNKEFTKQYIDFKILKTKTNVISKLQTLIPVKVYTPDFVIYWNDKKDYKLTDLLDETDGKYTKPFIKQYIPNIGSGSSLVEIKPIFDQNSMTRLFKTNQAIMWDKYAIYVNLVTYQELFERTFTPKKFLLTDTGRQERKIKWKVRTLEEYLNE